LQTTKSPTTIPDTSDTSSGESEKIGLLERFAASVTRGAEKWFPDAYIFAAMAVVVVALCALSIGAPLKQVGIAFGDGYWSLIPFTMQMAIVTISGYVVAVSPPAARLISSLAKWPKNGRSAVTFVAFVSVLTALINWAISPVFSALLVRAMGRRTDLKIDYRAAGAAAYLGQGALWTLGLSSSASLLQANPASLPKNLLALTGVIPLSETIFLPQSLLIVIVLGIASLLVAFYSAPRDKRIVTAEDMNISLAEPVIHVGPSRPGDWFERSPILTCALVGLGVLWTYHEISAKGPLLAVSNLNTYNFIFLMLGMLLHWRPSSFLAAISKSIPYIAGVLIQFPLYGGVGYMLTKATNGAGESPAHLLSNFFVSISSHGTFPCVMAIYSAVLGFFVPSAGGKWIIEAPYVMQAANDLHMHLGWAVTVYNAAEALPNLINPFWMLPLLGVLGMRVRDLIGFTSIQLIVHIPIVIGMLWVLAETLPYHPPVMP
jgi:short-chain fatty acids transporter